MDILNGILAQLTGAFFFALVVALLIIRDRNRRKETMKMHHRLNAMRSQKKPATEKKVDQPMRYYNQTGAQLQVGRFKFGTDIVSQLEKELNSNDEFYEKLYEEERRKGKSSK